ncbi:MAG: CHASE domain-containing protein [Actinobacteria bacterium]|nr:CHASE domain-containing protein [Actinomycetota bacterium]
MYRRRLTAAVVVVGLAVTIVAGVRVAATQRIALEQRLLVDAVTYTGAMQGELERHVGAAYALRDLFDDGPVVTRAQYERAIEALGPEQFPALHGISVIRPVEPGALSEFVREKRSGGYPGYPAADLSSPRTRWLVSLVAPYSHNGHLLGRDVRGHPELEATFARARDLAEPALARAVSDAGDPSSQRVGLAVPVYALGEGAATVAQRREHLVGWVVTDVHTAGLIDGVATQRDLEVVLVDETDGVPAPIGRSGVADGDHGAAVERTIDVYGRTWTVRVAPGSGYVAGIERHAPEVVLAVGLLLTAAFGALVHVLCQRSAHAQRLVSIRTGELAETNQQLVAVNGELALRLDEISQHAAVDGIVQRATREVSQALTFEDALDRVRIVLGEVATFDRVGFSVRVDGRRMRVVAVAGPAAPLAPAGVEYGASERLWQSFSTRDLVVSRDTSGARDGTIEHVLAQRGIAGIVTIPLVARGAVAGILTLAATTPLELAPRDLQLLSRVTDGIAGPLVTLLGLEAERQAAVQLRQLDQLKDEFVGVVAHDLKGPLSVVVGYTDLLLEQCDDGTLDADLARHALAAMQRAATDQERLIADLLESQRLALGVAVPSPAPVVVGDLVRDTIRDLGSGTRADVSFEDLSGSAVASADAEWLRRVVTNLTTNAWKYGGASIEVRVLRRPGTVRVEVTDHGPGIPAEDVPRLFQRFSRLGSGPGTPAGTGLGLYICKQLVEAQGGIVGVESIPGEGSTFWFSLPSSGVRTAVRA